MVNDFYTGVTTRIEELFSDNGERPRVYCDSLPQGFYPPCFFVTLVNVTNELSLWNRYILSMDFDIIYYPLKSPESDSEELNEVAYTLMYGLEYISVNGAFQRGTGLRYTIEDDVLHFFVTFKPFMLKKLKSSPTMNKLTQIYRYKY